MTGTVHAFTTDHYGLQANVETRKSAVALITLIEAFESRLRLDIAHTRGLIQRSHNSVVRRKKAPNNNTPYDHVERAGQHSVRRPILASRR